ncbi:UNVERIFIED_ORG: hypothetical protein J2806_001293 [Kosakonia oryzae]|nr:hypothetical protein [Kosakonia oryzae]SKC16175.1 hypothetical protein SAMN05216168_2123 [Kosakonia radicincitans]VVT54214.1 hypothetical protein UYSO10_5100 [Kosakonia radicincitans]
MADSQNLQKEVKQFSGLADDGVTDNTRVYGTRR